MNDYIAAMRKVIGHEMLLTVGCGAIIEDEHGRALFQKRTDHEQWGIPGGLLEIGEKVEDALIREVREETGLEIRNVSLFGIYSGEKGFAQYENGDKVFSIQLVFRTTQYDGVLQTSAEGSELSFRHKNNIPQEVNPHQLPFIEDWAAGVQTPVIK
ncbi:NUDIX hydrolase [Jeotgalibacillus campisalis]|uniref:UDP-sugar hydrolase n=1 Tax=Jeotgalibacillus campisalis TaxID=220754 RepID=A0A0C2QYX5_9BACL|nr:NUDIX domain-containing protein [Jeotgalibacillus campisalis]KIL43255.1 UDP-sugar hydrolase [Jeotgalibacillus campisalis]